MKKGCIRNNFKVNSFQVNPLRTNPIKWSNTNSLSVTAEKLSVFDLFVGLALKGLMFHSLCTFSFTS